MRATTDQVRWGSWLGDWCERAALLQPWLEVGQPQVQTSSESRLCRVYASLATADVVAAAQVGIIWEEGGMMWRWVSADDARADRIFEDSSPVPYELAAVTCWEDASVRRGVGESARRAKEAVTPRM